MSVVHLDRSPWKGFRPKPMAGQVWRGNYTKFTYDLLRPHDDTSAEYPIWWTRCSGERCKIICELWDETSNGGVFTFLSGPVLASDIRPGIEVKREGWKFSAGVWWLKIGRRYRAMVTPALDGNSFDWSTLTEDPDGGTVEASGMDGQQPFPLLATMLEAENCVGKP